MDRKIQYALIVAAGFFIFASPPTYKLMNSLTMAAGVPTANSAGCPNYSGLALHGAILGAILYVLLQQNYVIPLVS